jgi:phage-related minor tail protein
VGTGASGSALKGLEASAKKVGKSTPSSFTDVGTAIADVNTRLGLTGKPLETMSKKFLNLSRVTGTDLSTNIKDVSRVFGDWGVAIKDQPAALDKLFFTSQATGIGVDELSNKVVQFGAPMRQFGFSFEESAALMGKWHKEGVNTEVVMAGMKAGLGKLSKAGKDPVKAFAEIQEAIKGAGSVGEANAIAIETFGQRAGPDLAAAVREGRFEIGDLVKSMDGSKGAIEDADKRVGEFSKGMRGRLTLARALLHEPRSDVAEANLDRRRIGRGCLGEGLGNQHSDGVANMRRDQRLKRRGPTIRFDDR